MGASAAVAGGAAAFDIEGPDLKASNPTEEKVAALVEQAVSDLGYRLVRVRHWARDRVLQIMAERREGGMSLDDCETLSRALSPLLDVADPIAGEYDLQVSSPGIDRPLVELEDFERFAGHEAKLETAQMIEGRRRFRGMLVGVEGEAVKIAIPEGETTIPFASLSNAKLVLTDKLIEEDLRHAKALEAADAKSNKRNQ
jgi:ribosome maturation factor RimP